MITQLAKLFRISLSKGHTVIRIRDELQHAQSYVNIQKVRYKISLKLYLISVRIFWMIVS